MRSLIAFIAACVISALISVHAEQPASQSDSVRFEKISQLSTREFWKLGLPDTIHSGGLPIIGYWPFDPDEIVEDDGWRRIGIIGAGLGDVGETPVVAKVWAKPGIDFQFQESVDASKGQIVKAIAIFGAASAGCPDDAKEACDSNEVQLIVTKDGGVFVGTTKIGQIQ
ncbi:MAG TPA: hypothetical protein VNH64_01980 [Parvularculaceae bacterium]|nr:hypothetical protein [Parvularculaceae bacterium]